MPIYEYQQPDGTIRERHLPVNQRDAFPGRLTVPRRVGLAGLKEDPTGAVPAALRGLRECELQIGHEKLCQQIGYPPEEVKRIWAEP